MKAAIHLSSTVLLFFFFLISSLSLHAAVRINEVMSSNGTTIMDEDGSYSDWIELFNAGDQTVDLSGWGLSDNYSNLFKWTFPDETLIGPERYLIVWASGKNRSGEQLHTGFSISAAGEEILLTSPNGVVVDEIAPIEIPRDISYGRTQADPEVWTYFADPTPGEENSGSHSHFLLANISYSEPSRVFTTELNVTISGAEEGQVIRYTLDGSVPAADSNIYEEPFILTETTTLRARVFDMAGARGAIASSHYIHMDEDLAERRSYLPIIVMDARGQEITKTITVEGSLRYDGFFFVFDRNADGISSLNGVPDLSTRQGLRYRGSSSLDYPKKPYSVEFRDENDQDLSLGLLGMAPESDWVFYNGYFFDRAYIRNALIYELSRRIGRWASETRFVEVYVNHDGKTLNTDDYIGVYNVIERIKQGPDRLGPRNVNPGDIPPDGPIDVTQNGPWTGGYIFKIDRDDPDEYTWTPEYKDGLVTMGDSGLLGLVLSRPKLYRLDGGPYSSKSLAEDGSRQVAYITSYVKAFEEALDLDYKSSFSTRSYREFIDVDSWVDHLLINVFTLNADGLRLSAFYHKPENSPIAAGPVWDFDRSMGSYDYRDTKWDRWFYPYPLYGGVDYFNTTWWKYLMQDPDFVQTFYDRWAEWREGAFFDDALYNLITVMGDEIHRSDDHIGSAADRDAQRWPDSAHRDGDYLNEIDDLRTWVLNRAGWMDRRHKDGTLLPSPPLIEQNGDEIILTGDSGTTIYYTLDSSDPRASGGIAAGDEYIGPFSLNYSGLVTARAVDSEGNWSTLSRLPLNGDIGHPVRIHAWEFEDAESILSPVYSLSGSLQVLPGPETLILANTGGDFETQHLRVNNPLGAELIFTLSTTGYGSVTMEFETRRSGQGAGLQTLSYTVDGNNWVELETYIVFDDAPQPHFFDFSAIPGAENNPDFSVKITFTQGDGGNGGNNRFDNIIVLGVPLPGFNQPPVVTSEVGLLKLTEGEPDILIDLNTLFEDPDQDVLAFSGYSAHPDKVFANIDGSILKIKPIKRGDSVITVTAEDASNPEVSTSFRVLIYPKAHGLEYAAFSFNEWSPDEPAGNYPENMIFMQSDVDDPDLNDDMLYAYNIPLSDASNAVDAEYPYNASARTRINGLKNDGISLINTGRGRDLGSVIVSLDTTGQEDVRISFTAGTVLANSRIYALRLQYRAGLDGEWKDFESTMEYIRQTDGHSERFSLIPLPSDAHDRELVQIQWRYYHVEGTSGPRARLRLDDIYIGPDIDYAMVYGINDNGRIEGSVTQDITGGHSGTPVTAVPDEGYVFMQWSDGRIDNPRFDTNVSSNKTVKALFHISGDMNLNGQIDPGDAVALIRHAAGLTELSDLQKRIGNITGHESYDDAGLADVIRLLQIMIRLD